jgi:hypothetical protein
MGLLSVNTENLGLAAAGSWEAFSGDGVRAPGPGLAALLGEATHPTQYEE